MSGDLEPGQARIRHPDLDPDGVIVPAEAVPHHERAGWEFVEGDRETWPAELQKYGGQPGVRIYHPILDRTVEVAESAVPYHREKGWVLAAEAEAERLEAKKVADLRQLAKDRGISPIPSTKDELVAALQDQDQAGDEPAQPEEDEG